MYLGDVRENRRVVADGKENKISYWRMFDNRETTKYEWFGSQIDLDGMSPEDATYWYAWRLGSGRIG